jgi:uncharacterized Fe-S cluster protein YjdI
MEIKKKYTNGEVTVVWEPSKCIHSAICFKSLPTVFNPRQRPWITMDGAESQVIIDQIQACPSGALSYLMNAEIEVEKQPEHTATTVVEVLGNGPLLIHGTIEVKGKDGQQSSKYATTAFCRCGSSNTKPYCDGSHVSVAFEG